MAGELGDEFEVLAEVEHGEVCEFGGGCDHEIGNRRCSVLAPFGEDRLHLESSVFDPGCQVLDGQGREESMMLRGPDTSAAETAFRALYELEANRQVRTATLMLGSQVAAQDVVHDAFLALWRRWDTVSEPGPYLTRSVMNGCRDQLRRARTARRAFGRLVDDDSAPSDDPELFDALSRLRFEHRAAVVLRFYLQYSEAEIARHLGCRPGSVGPWIRRGLDQLTSALTDAEETR